MLKYLKHLKFFAKNVISVYVYPAAVRLVKWYLVLVLMQLIRREKFKKTGKIIITEGKGK